VHIPEVVRSSLGTPLLSDIFRKSEAAAEGDVVGYLNADIIVAADPGTIVQRLGRSKFLIVGRRRELPLDGPIDFDDPGWRQNLEDRYRTLGRLGTAQGIDSFIYRKGSMGELPPFIIGRPWWDNWFIGEAIRRRLMVIDATEELAAYHPDHGYSHVPQGRGRLWRGPEGDQNERLFRDRLFRPPTFSVDDAGFMVRDGRVVAVSLTPEQRRRRRHARNAGLLRWIDRARLFFRPGALAQASGRKIAAALSRISGRWQAICRK
jgi:hypothetical protein